jgi:hypothetical protein
MPHGKPRATLSCAVPGRHCGFVSKAHRPQVFISSSRNIGRTILFDTSVAELGLYLVKIRPSDVVYASTVLTHSMT